MSSVVTAVFQDGVLKPTRKLKLRPNEKVKLHIVRKAPLPAAEDLGPLAGAFPELAHRTDKDLAAAKRIWARGLTKHIAAFSKKGSRR